MENKIAIIDYGLGNTHSIGNALKFLDYSFSITRQKVKIEKAQVLIIPGVGSFGEAMMNFKKFNLIDILNEEVLYKKKPVLGICLGMQIFADKSEEDKCHPGLGWIKGEVIKLKLPKKYRVPHVGWNNVGKEIINPLFSKCSEDPNFYFDHSYHFICQNSFISAKCNYGIDLVAAVQKENIFGTQFHPEKSQTNGLKLFRSFFEYNKVEY